MFPSLKTSLAPLVLRLGLAGIFVYHASLKLLVNGGTGWTTTLSPTMQMMVAWTELIGGLAIALGLFTRLAALGFTIFMVGAILTVTGAHGFVQLGNYFGRSFEEEGRYRWNVGYEYNFAIIVICLALLIFGAGRWSVDYLLFRGRKEGTGATSPSPGPAMATAQPALRDAPALKSR